MNVYIFQAALICEECASVARQGLTPSEDSDEYPCGPYADGGGEADAPQHCDHCNKFLENPLTREGREYAELQILEFEQYGFGDFNVLGQWVDFYSIPYKGNKRS